MRDKKLVVANWKMNPATVAEAKRLFLNTKKCAQMLNNVQVVVCPPAAYISELKRSYSGRKMLLGAQDAFWGKEGAHTGEISAPMLGSVGATYALVGHSDMRERGETNDDVRRKVGAVTTEGLTAILCVGERERDDHGEYLSFIKEEVGVALTDVPQKALKQVVITYEPIWSIGGDAEDAMVSSDVHQMVLFIRKILTERYDKKAAFRVPILYGGSVEPENSDALLQGGAIDGFLIGHASLDTRAFSYILQSADESL